MAIKVKFIGDTSDLEASSKRASSAIGSVAKIAGGFVLAEGLMKLPGLLGGTVSAASDLSESMSKVNVVLGPAAKGMDAWAEGMSKMGQSKGEALSALGTFANFFTTIGESQADAARMSKSLAELASDFASFHNADPSEVILAMGAALRGEAEPMSRYGILMNDATLKAEAFKMGLISSEKEGLSPQTKSAGCKLADVRTGR